jgi:hypothetical protein
MEQAAIALEAIGESVVFLDHFKELPDPRQRSKITYPLDEVLLLSLLAVLGGAETFVDIARLAWPHAFSESMGLRSYLVRQLKPQ